MAVTKVINSESKAYKPVLTDMLVLDAVPTVNSLNGVTSDAVARAIAGASGEVPQVTESDNGKVLTAVYDEGGAAVEWAEAQGGGSVTTVDKAFTVGVNGTGLPITVDCANASPVTSSTKTDTMTSIDGSDSLNGDISVGALFETDIDEIIPGPWHVSLTIPSDITNLGDFHCGGNLRIAFYVPGSSSYGHYAPLDDTSILWPPFITQINAGTYEFDINFPGEVGVAYPSNKLAVGLIGGGQYWNDFKTAVADAIEASPWTLAISNNVTTGYSITPSVLPASTSLDENKVLTVNASGNAVWANPATPSVDEVPDVTSADDGKVLTASYSGGQGSYSWQTAQGGGGGGGITWTKITNMTTTSYSLSANFSYSIPSGKTAVQVTLMLRLSEISGSWSNIPKQLSVKLKLTDDYGSDYYYVGSIISADAWSSSSFPTVWMVAGTVVVPSDWFHSIDGIQLELPMSTSSLPENYTKALFVGIA